MFIYSPQILAVYIQYKYMKYNLPPKNSGAQFAINKFSGAQSAGAQFAGARFATNKFSGAQSAGAQFAGARYAIN